MAIMNLDHVFAKKPRFRIYHQPREVRRNRPDVGLPKEWIGNSYVGDTWRNRKNLINILGRKFWNLIVIERDRTKSSRAYSYWICECTCGRRYSIRSDRLRGGEVYACRVCTIKVNRTYQQIRNDKEAKRIIERAVMRRMSLQIKEGLNPSPSSLYIPGHIYSKGAILQMRDEFRMSIPEISELVSLTVEEVRGVLIQARGKSLEGTTAVAVPGAPKQRTTAEMNNPAASDFVEPKRSKYRVHDSYVERCIEPEKAKKVLDEDREKEVNKNIQELVKQREEEIKTSLQELQALAGMEDLLADLNKLDQAHLYL